MTPEQTKTTLHEAMLGAGIRPAKAGLDPVLDGKVRRFDIEGRPAGKKHGWYVGHTDGTDAWGAFGDWKEDQRESWCNRNPKEITPAERQAFARRRAEIDAAVETERAQMAARAATKAADLMAKGQPVAADHPYVVAKGIKPVGAAQLRDMLVVPLRRDGVTVTAQCIHADGRKTFLTGGATGGASLVLGSLTNAKTVLLCEGWATGCTLHEATGLPVVVGFNAGNLPVLAERMKGKLDADIVVCGDRDPSEVGQRAAQRAASVFGTRGRAVIPAFTREQETAFAATHDGTLPTDFNDLAAVAGLAAVTALVLTETTDPLQAEQPEPFEHDTAPTPWPDDCLPGLMQQAAEAIAEHVQVPPALAGFAVLSAVAHVAQRITDAASPKVGRMPCSLFLLSLADSGDRKSTAFGVASRPIAEAEREERQRHASIRDRIAKEAANAKPAERDGILLDTPRDPRTIFTEATFERIAAEFMRGSRPALSWATDEGVQFFGGHTLKSDTRASAMGSLTRLYDGRGVERDRMGADSGSGVRYGVRFGVFLSAQQAAVAPSLHDPLLRQQGLLPRFLLAAPHSLAGTRFLTGNDLLDRMDADQRIGHYWRVLARMGAHPEAVDEHGGLELPEVVNTPDAVAVWLDFYNATERRLDPLDGDLSGGLKPFGSRSAENAARVAAVFAAWRHFEQGGELAVSGDDMTRACRLVNYSLSEWQRLGESSQLSATERDAYGLLRFLQGDAVKWESFSKMEIGQCAPGVLRKDAGRRNAALTELVERRWLGYDERRFTLRKAADEKPKQGPAVAVFAVSAVSDPADADKNSKNSRNSNSNTPKTHSAEPPPPPVGEAYADATEQSIEWGEF